MTPYAKRLTPTTRRMAEDMLVRNLSASTIDSYTYHVDQFLKHCGRPAEELGPEEIRQFQLHLIQEKNVGWSSFNQAVCGLRFLYRFTIPRDWHIKMIPFGKRPKKLPLVLGQEDAGQLIQCTTNLKHRTVLLTQYAAGLRLSEACHLQITDIDSKRMQLRITCGKGRKERRVPMSPRLLTALRDYWRECRPPSYLFPGKTPDVPLSSTTVQKACKAAARQAGLSPAISPHTLRHSFATGLLEAGVDLLTIGQLLGHKSFTTTMIYLHVRRPHLNSTPSPIDWLPVRQCPRWQDGTTSQANGETLN
ncbi:MAG: site-specific integrase [Planctomycetes bacterium]|nr:site-specific integrase [Planctomycetota bacterium]